MTKIITNKLNGNAITTQSILAVKAALVPMVEKAFDKKLDRHSIVARAAVEWLNENDVMDEHLVDALNKMKGERNIQGALDALALRMRLPKELINVILKKQKAMYFLEYTKLVLAGTIIDALGELGYIEVDVRHTNHVNQVSGRKYSIDSNWYIFQDKITTMFDPITGLPLGVHTEPGVVGATKLSLNSWERDIKFNGEQKQFLRDIASVAWRLIDRDAEWWTKYFKTSGWYTQALDKGTEDRILLDERVTELVSGIVTLTQQERLYHSYGFSLSGRLIAKLTTVGINFHGDGKLIWQYADERIITEADVLKAKEHICKYRFGNSNQKDALAEWDSHADGYLLSWARNYSKDMMKQVYLEGCAEIITTGVGGTTRRVLGEDLSTNGVAIFASNFRDPKMAKVANIGGHKGLYDAHTTMGDVMGFDDRNEAKLINAGLFHGENIKNIAKKVNLPAPVIRTGLIDGFGIRATYFNRIAKHVGGMIDNMTTSTRMRSPEGWYFVNQAYAQRSVVKVTFPSLSTDSGLRTVEVIRDMPLLFPQGGSMPQNILYVNKNRPDLNGVLKMSGGYANSVHMLDAWMLREVLRRTGFDTLTVHDNYFCTGEKLQLVKQSIRASHVKMWKNNFLLANINYMAEHCAKDIKPLVLSVGELPKTKILNSENFMQP